MRLTANKFCVFMVVFFIVRSITSGEAVSESVAAKVAENWPKYVGLSESSRLVKEVYSPAWFDTDIARVVEYHDSGWALVPTDDILLPIFAFSPSEAFPRDDNPAIRELLDIMQRYYDFLKDCDSVFAPGAIAARNNIWRDVMTNSVPQQAPSIIGPLCSSDWYQSGVYNDFCPDVTGLCNLDECPAGCVAIAMSQIMYYWRHPITGTGVSNYTTATYGIPIIAIHGITNYDWNNMQDQVWAGSPPNQINAVAELCFHAGASVYMDYCLDNNCESGANSQNVDNALEDHFGYWQDVTYQSANTDDLMDELRFQRPIYVRGTSDRGGHAWVCDGYNIGGSTVLFHWRMGWNGCNNVWQTVDQIPGDNCDDLGGLTYQNHVRFIAPENVEFAVNNGSCNTGSPNCPYDNLNEAVNGISPGSTLIIKTGTHYPGPITISKSMTIKGIGVTIGQ